MKKWIIIFCLLFFVGEVYAHKLNVFAFVEGDQVNVEAYFSDGILAKNAKVIVTDSEGNLFYEGRADDKGWHQFQASGQTDLLIKINAGLGHIASYQLGASNVPATKAKSPVGESPSIGADNPDMQKALADAIKPLAREIAELRQKTRISDIVGGIGYILGILGLFAYLKYRKESQNS